MVIDNIFYKLLIFVLADVIRGEGQICSKTTFLFFMVFFTIGAFEECDGMKFILQGRCKVKTEVGCGANLYLVISPHHILSTMIT